MSTVTCSDFGCNGKPSFKIPMRSLKASRLAMGADEILLCKSCYLEGLRMAREELEIKRIQGFRDAQTQVEWLDREIAHIQSVDNSNKR